MHRSRVLAVRLALALAGVAAITFICARVIPVNASTVGFAYLILILGIATLYGLTEAVVASVASMLAYNFFFLPPFGQFTIADPQNWVALLTFLVTALVASQLSNRAKNQAAEAKKRQQETERLYAFSRAILLTDSAQPVGAQAAQQIAQIFDAAAVVLYDAESGSTFLGGMEELAGVEGMLKQVVLQGAPHQDPSTGVGVWPIALGGHSIGALAAKGIAVSDGAVQALLNLVAIALERVHTEEAANRAEVARQSEEFKSTLLDAIAHEFKTPLTSIKAAATSLLAEPGALNVGQAELTSIIDEETDRLNRLVTEAVHMSQIDAGKVKLERARHQVDSIVRTTADGFGSRGDGRLEAQADLAAMPPVWVDADLTTLALRQLIDNSLKYSPPSSTVQIAGVVEAERVVLKVVDSGPGIPERDRERIFDKFYRRVGVRGKVPGSGMGLHIAREIARTQGGDLWVEAAREGGSEFCLALPLVPEEDR